VSSIVLSRHLYFPLADLLKGTPVARRLRELRWTQWRTEAELRAIAAGELARTIEAARRETPFYGERLAGIGPVTAGNVFEALRDIPILTPAQVFEHGDRMRGRGGPGRIVRGHMGGPAGAVVEFPMTTDFIARTEAAQWRGREWWGMCRGDPMLVLWGRSTGDGRDEARIARRERLRNWLRLSAFRMSRKDIVEYVRMIEEFRPRFIYGYGAAIYQLALHYSEERLRPPPGLEAVFFAADALRDFQRRLVEETLGAPTAREYGSSEGGAFAFQCREGAIHVASENVHAEIVRGGAPVGDGEEGELVITVFHNRAMPLIRYNLGDWGRRVPGRCACGRYLPRIEPTITRVDDLVRTSQGKAASGHLFDSILMELIDRGLRGIRQFLVVQKELDRFSVQIVPGPDLDSECLGLFERRVRERLGERVVVAFEIVPEIPRDADGKIRNFRSEIGSEGDTDAAVRARASLARRRKAWCGTPDSL